jgi:hypothetical protein
VDDDRPLLLRGGKFDGLYDELVSGCTFLS